MKTCCLPILLTLALLASPGLSPASRYASAPALSTSRGAASLSELGQALFLALQTNRPDQLAAYFPSDADLASLQQKGAPALRTWLRQYTAADLESAFKNDFHSIRQQTVARTLHWPDLSLTEVRVNKPGAGSRQLRQVTLRLHNPVNQPLTIRFEALRLQNRYYLLGRAQLAGS